VISRLKNASGIGRRFPLRKPGEKRTGIRRRTSFHRGAHAQTMERAEQPPLTGDARAIQERVQALDADQLLERYHELTDKRLDETIQYTEWFELDLIEARLDAEDREEVERLAALQDNWRRERNEVVASIERLLARFKTIQ